MEQVTAPSFIHTANISEVPPVPKPVRCPRGHKEKSSALMTLGSAPTQWTERKGC